MSNNFYQSMRFTLPISLIAWALFIWLCLAVTGCASLAPNYVAPELEHISHATQHAPFTDHPTPYGANLALVTVGYNLPHHLNVELSEGVSLDRHYRDTDEWGEIKGPREQFSVRLRYMIQLRP